MPNVPTLFSPILFLAIPLSENMLSRQPIVNLVALLLFAIFQLCLFQSQISNIEDIAPFFATPYESPRSDFRNDDSAFDPLLPDVSRPKIRQVSMRVYNITNTTNDALDERCMVTHITHGKRWGYPTHILRQDVRGKGQWRELVFSKPLYMLSIAVAEMAKSPHERAEWLV